MIDTLDLMLLAKYYNKKQIDNLRNLLQNVKTQLNSDGEVIQIRGNIRNYKITINAEMIYFNGSISNFLYGSNIIPIQRSDLLHFIQELKRETGLRIQHAEIIRVDLAVDLFLDSVHKLYLPYFLETHGYIKGIDPYDGITYSKLKRKKNFEFDIYDKQEAIKQQSPEILKLLKENLPHFRSIMRLELRLKKAVKKTLLPATASRKIAYILSKQFNHRLLDLWFKEFNAINKLTSEQSSLDFTGGKELKDLLASIQIQNYGLNNVLHEIEVNANQKKWSSKKKSVVKSEIKRMYNSKIGATKHHYISEIEEKIAANSDFLNWMESWDYNIQNLKPKK